MSSLRRNFLLSLAVHALLFGAGIALALSGGLDRWSAHATIVVSLLNDGALGRQPVPEQNAVADLPEERTDSDPSPEPGPQDVQRDQGVPATAADPANISSEQWVVIVNSIERAKRYPRLARERGIQGIVRLRFKVRPRGDVDTVEVIESSGSEVLDLASVNTVYRASPLPYVRGWVELPISYVLK